MRDTGTTIYKKMTTRKNNGKTVCRVLLVTIPPVGTKTEEILYQTQDFEADRDLVIANLTAPLVITG